MVAVVGTNSGKEFVVLDGATSLTDLRTGKLNQVFISADSKLRIVIPDEKIEFYQEENTEEKQKALQELIAKTVETETLTKNRESSDVNFG